ncbi:unnamed protein product [Notodromas monacha]|uniref:START domain-containing protein n=1 Tax=Notodromas monacha TaxID=399045 RepID=A0A7R9BM19_9CRUS|nr:unnamed protein product [Notodromas monacha]CAG0916663.1 unnamed protein product [Notodromas monacha]
MEYERFCNPVFRITFLISGSAQQANCEALWARFSEAADEAYAIANRRDWHVDSNDDGVVVKRVYLPTYKRSVILGETILNISPEDGLYLYWDDGKDIPNWNPEISYLEDVVEIAPELRVSYQVGSSKLGGLIKPRDFLVLTGWLERNRNYYVVYTNITNEYRPKPIESHYVRGQNGPSLIAFERVPTDPNKTLFRYLLNVDMNHGSWFIIPRSVYEKATSAAIRDYLQYVRDRTNRVPLFSPPRKSIRPHHTNLF